jgi:hypothetical protein
MLICSLSMIYEMSHAMSKYVQSLNFVVIKQRGMKMNIYELFEMTLMG